ncbi:lantibiotic ABC transporter permease [Paenibacillus cisolokensis]|uniref:Lantibiotic ABC transporter permease n=1 Tax=Paenibacillus cisolokensis TaxID=1658519 RepID=A0ABQ4N1M9_9BACL|nr:sugar ABC transporter ATP-binding protein [Paenibacillus cisolokensis]GIQ62076.1 lantibiotic ABC transporter permease [Paenibacillus cisolokensis]
MAAEYQLEMNQIKKSFGSVKVLENVTFKVRPGEIHALLGENGAGKSTLMKVLSGVYQKDGGEIKLNGKPVEIKNPNQGKQLGIGIIYQEFALAPDLTVAENIFLGNLIRKHGMIRWSDMNAKARELLNRIGFDIHPQQLVGELSVAYQQVVEICKSLSQNAKVLILDEPTAVLAPKDVRQLFLVLKKLRDQGVSIVYISHRLEEIFEIADRITVIKDGAVTGTVRPSEVTKEELIGMMIGRKLTTLFPERNVEPGPERLRVKQVSTKEKLKDVSFTVRAGEVVGLAGLVGSGRTEVARALFGIDKIERGEVELDGRPLKLRSPREAIRQGIGLVPESRKEDGLVLEMPIGENMTMTNTKMIRRFGNVIMKGKERQIAESLIERLRIKTDSYKKEAGNLSGGNQQKIVLAKWYHTDTKVLILDEPTRGVDVGAKVEIYQLINELAAKGMAIVMISSELLEIIGMCDRVYVMNEGEIKGSLTREELSEDRIMSLAVGGV